MLPSSRPGIELEVPAGVKSDRAVGRTPKEEGQKEVRGVRGWVQGARVRNKQGREMAPVSLAQARGVRRH